MIDPIFAFFGGIVTILTMALLAYLIASKFVYLEKREARIAGFSCAFGSMAGLQVYNGFPAEQLSATGGCVLGLLIVWYFLFKREKVDA